MKNDANDELKLNLTCDKLIALKMHKRTELISASEFRFSVEKDVPNNTRKSNLLNFNFQSVRFEPKRDAGTV